MSQKEALQGEPRRGDITVDRPMATLTGPKLRLRHEEPVPCPIPWLLSDSSEGRGLCARRMLHISQRRAGRKKSEARGSEGAEETETCLVCTTSLWSGSCSVESSARPLTRNGVGTLSATITTPRRHLHLLSLLPSKSSNSQSTAQHTLTQTHSFRGSVSVAFDRAPMLHMFTTHSRHD